jgi:hypothetical protein
MPEYPPSIFTASFLARLTSGEPPEETAEAVSEAEFAGPWTIDPHENGWAVLAEGEPPALLVQAADTARLGAAVLPGLGRPTFFQLGEQREAAGYPLFGSDGRALGHCSLFNPALPAAMHTLECIRRDPWSLAQFLAACRDAGLARAGRLLAIMEQGARS